MNVAVYCYAPLESMSNVVESISIGASEIVPIPIEVGESIFKPPDEETDKVPCPSNVVLLLTSYQVTSNI